MYARGKFGIEYTPSEPKPESSSLGRVVFVVVLAAVALVVRAVWLRVTARDSTDAGDESRPPASACRQSTPVHGGETAGTNDQRRLCVRAADYSKRPVKIRNLLLRLNEADRLGDVEMAVSTIEQLRDTPGAADLDDRLAQRLGALNYRRLFERKSAQWTVEVAVKRGDSATRIAYEHGSTLASLGKLNDNKIEKLKIGQKLTVMNHPRFNLVITRRTRTADLQLNGKFFKRYYLTDEVTGNEGSYETGERFRTFCAEMGVSFRPLDRAELEMLMPRGTAVFIREL